MLFSHLPADQLISHLCELLSKKKLHKPSNSEWQKCALLAVEILMSQSLMDSPSAADRIYDIIVTPLPLMFLHRHGNTFAGKVAATVHKTSLAKHHQFFGKFNELLENEGTCGYMCTYSIVPNPCVLIVHYSFVLTIEGYTEQQPLSSLFHLRSSLSFEHPFPPIIPLPHNYTHTHTHKQAKYSGVML